MKTSLITVHFEKCSIYDYAPLSEVQIQLIWPIITTGKGRGWIYGFWKMSPTDFGDPPHITQAVKYSPPLIQRCVFLRHVHFSITLGFRLLDHVSLS